MTEEQGKKAPTDGLVLTALRKASIRDYLAILAFLKGVVFWVFGRVTERKRPKPQKVVFRHAKGYRFSEYRGYVRYNAARFHAMTEDDLARLFGLGANSRAGMKHVEEDRRLTRLILELMHNKRAFNRVRECDKDLILNYQREIVRYLNSDKCAIEVSGGETMVDLRLRVSHLFGYNLSTFSTRSTVS